MSPTLFPVCGYSLNVESSRRLEELMSVGRGDQKRALTVSNMAVTQGRDVWKQSIPEFLGSPSGGSNPTKHRSPNSELQISGSFDYW